MTAEPCLLVKVKNVELLSVNMSAKAGVSIKYAGLVSYMNLTN